MRRTCTATFAGSATDHALEGASQWFPHPCSMRCYLSVTRGAVQACRRGRAPRGLRAQDVGVRSTLASLPPIIQPGTTPAAPSNRGALVATFAPASPGQVVTLERRTRRGWRPSPRAVRTPGDRRRSPPGPGTYRARTTSDDRTWITGSGHRRPLGAELEDTFSGTTLDTSVWNAQGREHESVYAPRTCARSTPARAGEGRRAAARRRRSTPRWPGSPAATRPTAPQLGNQPLPAHQPGLHRAHPLLPARHRRRPHQAAAREGHALRLLDAPERHEVLRRTTRRPGRRST